MVAVVCCLVLLGAAATTKAAQPASKVLLGEERPGLGGRRAGGRPLLRAPALVAGRLGSAAELPGADGAVRAHTEVTLAAAAAAEGPESAARALARADSARLVVLALGLRVLHALLLAATPRMLRAVAAAAGVARGSGGVYGPSPDAAQLGARLALLASALMLALVLACRALCDHASRYASERTALRLRAALLLELHSRVAACGGVFAARAPPDGSGRAAEADGGKGALIAAAAFDVERAAALLEHLPLLALAPVAALAAVRSAFAQLGGAAAAGAAVSLACVGVGVGAQVCRLVRIEAVLMHARGERATHLAAAAQAAPAIAAQRRAARAATERGAMLRSVETRALVARARAHALLGALALGAPLLGALGASAAGGLTGEGAGAAAGTLGGGAAAAAARIAAMGAAVAAIQPACALLPRALAGCAEGLVSARRLRALWARTAAATGRAQVLADPSRLPSSGQSRAWVVRADQLSLSWGGGSERLEIAADDDDGADCFGLPLLPPAAATASAAGALFRASSRAPRRAASRRPCALRNVSLQLAAGELLVLTGPVGAGKSTLLRALLAAGDGDGAGRDARAPAVIAGGAAVRAHAPRRGRRAAAGGESVGAETGRPARVSFVGQPLVLPAGVSIREAIVGADEGARARGGTQESSAAAGWTARRGALALDGASAEADAADGWLRRVLRACALDDALASLPDGVETLLPEDGRGGECGAAWASIRARVALARAVYARPDLLLLDESALAPLGVRELARVSRALFGRPWGASEEGAEGARGGQHAAAAVAGRARRRGALLRGCACVAVGSYAPLLRAADAVLVLEGGAMVGRSSGQEAYARTMVGGEEEGALGLAQLHSAAVSANAHRHLLSQLDRWREHWRPQYSRPAVGAAGGSGARAARGAPAPELAGARPLRGGAQRVARSSALSSPAAPTAAPRAPTARAPGRGALCVRRARVAPRPSLLLAAAGCALASESAAILSVAVLQRAPRPAAPQAAGAHERAGAAALTAAAAALAASGQLLTHLACVRRSTELGARALGSLLGVKPCSAKAGGARAGAREGTAAADARADGDRGLSAPADALSALLRDGGALDALLPSALCSLLFTGATGALMLATTGSLVVLAACAPAALLAACSARAVLARARHLRLAESSQLGPVLRLLSEAAEGLAPAGGARSASAVERSRAPPSDAVGAAIDRATAPALAAARLRLVCTLCPELIGAASVAAAAYAVLGRGPAGGHESARVAAAYALLAISAQLHSLLASLAGAALRAAAAAAAGLRLAAAASPPWHEAEENAGGVPAAAAGLASGLTVRARERGARAPLIGAAYGSGGTLARAAIATGGGSVRSALDPASVCADGRLWDALDACGLGEAVDALELDGRDARGRVPAGRRWRASQLSAGEQRRLGLAALLCSARTIETAVVESPLDLHDASTERLARGFLRSEQLSRCTRISGAPGQSDAMLGAE